ncbi:hypothetical protein M758_1G223900 [Ceratodon purpureus]|uniref:Patatin n=1 Tax=Ceratodon purpureus TaxID=3225 RepID=A0A8T0JA47_CERPU|nr:hypothetical protein KC19_1G195900 [Ceratodon purpureus]KAG0631051.1 hypothetical protein M758_1G223900 [Ceratodon purpureus]
MEEGGDGKGQAVSSIPATAAQKPKRTNVGHGTETSPAKPPQPIRRENGPPPRRLYHAASIEENTEFKDTGIFKKGGNTDSYKDDGGLARMSSASMVGIRSFLETYPSKIPLEADAGAQIQRGPIGGGKSGLQGWDSDLLDLPVGEGGPPTKRKLCILSMDGGGIRGLIAARILTRLENLIKEKLGDETSQVHLSDYFDLFTGSSTGAILATMLVVPDDKGRPLFTAKGCCDFYSKNGSFIFRPRWYDPFHGSVRQLYRPKYSPRRFENLLKEYTIQKDGKVLTLLDTLKPLLITSFDISRATPFFFVRQAAQNDPSRNFSLWEACRATAAAPTFFPPAFVTSVDGKFQGTMIDGGAIQNNPALVATTHGIANNDDFPYATGLSDLLVLSLGAGQGDQKHEFTKAKKWGMTGWVRPLMSIMMDGTSDTVDYQLAAAFAGHNCAENYLRIQLSGLPNKTALMDCCTPENIQDLIKCTEDLLQQKAVMRNENGDRITLAETFDERLSWFADQLIIQKKLREEPPKDPSFSDHSLPPSRKEGMGPQGQMVSPLFAHMFDHKEFADSKKARSFRF